MTDDEVVASYVPLRYLFPLVFTIHLVINPVHEPCSIVTTCRLFDSRHVLWTNRKCHAEIRRASDTSVIAVTRQHQLLNKFSKALGNENYNHF